MIALLCCVCYDEKQTKTLLFLLLQNYNTFSKHKMLNLKLFSYTHKQNRKDRVMSDKEDVIQALVVLQLTKGHF